MMKRADGSYSPRGLWDNIRANKGSGKKPTAEMLKQEKKDRLLMIVENKEDEHKEVKQTRKRLDDDQAVTDMFEERRNKLNKKLIDKFIKPIKKEGNTE